MIEPDRLTVNGGSMFMLLFIYANSSYAMTLSATCGISLTAFGMKNFPNFISLHFDTETSKNPAERKKNSTIVLKSNFPPAKFSPPYK